VDYIPLFTLHPSPFILHPSLFTLHSSPFTLHPSSFTLHPSPSTLHPSPFTLHSPPSTLHPPLFTLSSEPSIVDTSANVPSTNRRSSTLVPMFPRPIVDRRHWCQCQCSLDTLVSLSPHVSRCYPRGLRSLRVKGEGVKDKG
jgi:hypothetical protein